MILENSNLNSNNLSGKTVLLTGGGGGIGYEAARAFVWLGANVIIAENDEVRGKKAQENISKEFRNNKAIYYKMDISNRMQIDELYTYINEQYGFLDILFNNATITPLGAVDSVSIEQWDRSYEVNLKGPIMLVQKFLPDMKTKNKGTIVFVPSSGAAPYMGAYEIFKTGQVELCNTLFGELVETKILTYCIGPGLVKTETAQRGIEKVADLMGISLEEFYRVNENHMLSAEEAGVGFAVSTVFAEQYNGNEIGSIQALMDADIIRVDEKIEGNSNPTHEDKDIAIEHLASIVKVYKEQYAGWLNMNIFERQWVLRDFKKTVKKTGEEVKSILDNYYLAFINSDSMVMNDNKYIFELLRTYYQRQYKLLQGYEKNPQKLKDNSESIMNWINELEIFISLV